MTKKEFQKQFGDKAAELMTNPAFLIALDVAREDCPYANGGSALEATSIIRNEGRVTGWMECLRFLKTIAKSEPDAPPVVQTPLYADPDARKNVQSDKNKK